MMDRKKQKLTSEKVSIGSAGAKANSCCIDEVEPKKTFEMVNAELSQLHTKISELEAKVREQEKENTQLARYSKECEEKYRASQKSLKIAEEKLAQFSHEPQTAAQESSAQIRGNLINDRSSSCSDRPDSDEDRGNLIIDSSSSFSDESDSDDFSTHIKESSVAALNINSMREEILIKIFGYLSHNDLGRTAQVCRRWNALSRNPDLWGKVNVVFSRYRGSQNLVAECFINILPPRVTSLTLDFWNKDDWIDLLNFEEISMRLRKRCPILKILMLENAKLSVNLPSIIDISTMLLPNLRRLALHSSIFPHCPSTEEEECGETCKIKVLDLFGCYITYYNKPPLSRMPHLKKLFLACTDVDDSWFEDITYFLRQLRELDLRDTDISSRTFRLLQIHARNLRELYLCDTGVDLDEDYLNFRTSDFPRLKTICLRHNGVSCEGIISLIKACKSLRNVYVEGSVVDSYEEHPFVNYNECNLGIVKDDCCSYMKSRYFV